MTIGTNLKKPMTDSSEGVSDKPKPDDTADANRPLSLVEVEDFARSEFRALLRCDGSELNGPDGPSAEDDAIATSGPVGPDGPQPLDAYAATPTAGGHSSCRCIRFR